MFPPQLYVCASYFGVVLTSLLPSISNTWPVWRFPWISHVEILHSNYTYNCTLTPQLNLASCLIQILQSLLAYTETKWSFQQVTYIRSLLRIPSTYQSSKCLPLLSPKPSYGFPTVKHIVKFVSQCPLWSKERSTQLKIMRICLFPTCLLKSPVSLQHGH